jgi:site-specific recombinase XerD
MTLDALITQYITFRRALGHGYEKPERTLKAFSRAMGTEIELSALDPGKVKAFLDGTGAITTNWHQKYSTLRMLFDYGLKHRLLTTVPLPTHIPKRPPAFVPYLYSRAELRRLMETTATYRTHYFKLAPATLRALLLLLYGAGLRVSEALALDVVDVDLAAGLLTIRDTKFHKTRWVPLGSDLQQALTQYAAQRTVPTPESPFFPAKDGARLQYKTVNSAFRRLRAKAGIMRTDGARYQPRLHDLRHTFAVDRLTAWYRAGADVQRLLPKLSTYLGHAHLTDTQVYLTLTPELLAAAAGRFAQYAFQEVSQ